MDVKVSHPVVQGASANTVVGHGAQVVQIHPWVGYCLPKVHVGVSGNQGLIERSVKRQQGRMTYKLNKGLHCLGGRGAVALALYSNAVKQDVRFARSLILF
jgi:hypothetical protein